MSFLDNAKAAINTAKLLFLKDVETTAEANTDASAGEPELASIEDYKAELNNVNEKLMVLKNEVAVLKLESRESQTILHEITETTNKLNVALAQKQNEVSELKRIQGIVRTEKVRDVMKDLGTRIDAQMLPTGSGNNDKSKAIAYEEEEANYASQYGFKNTEI